MTNHIVKIILAVAVLMGSAAITNFLVRDPAFVLVVLMSGALGYCLFGMVHHSGWMVRDRLTKHVIAESLNQMRLTGQAPVGQDGQEADASRYRRLDSSLEQYCKFLLGA